MVKKTDYGQQEAIEEFDADRRLWATDTLEVLGEGSVEGLKIVSLDWSNGKPERKEDNVRTLPAQLVILAMGFVGPEASLVEAFGGGLAKQGRPLPVVEGKGHGLSGADGKARVYCAGDTRNGSTIVVNAISDGLACAAEVADDLLG